MMQRSATAIWRGAGKDGSGEISTPSRVLNNTFYNSPNRFEQVNGTSPEELVAAAHAGCYSMAFAYGLTENGTPAESITTTANVILEKEDSGWTVTRVELTVNGRVPGIDATKFSELAEGAKNGCPISRLLKAEISLTAKLEA